MEKFIPYEKLSKKKQREIDRTKRSSWGQLSPVTRKAHSLKAYNRKKKPDWKFESSSSPAYYFCLRALGRALGFTPVALT